MSRKVMTYMLGALECICQMMVFTAAVFILAFGFFRTPTTTVFKCLYVSVFSVLVMFLGRKIIKNRILFILIHIALFAGLMALVPSLNEKLGYVVVMIAEIAHSLIISGQEKKAETEDIHIGFLALFIGGQLLGNYIENALISQSCLIMAFAFILIKIIYHHIANELDFFSVNVDTANVPYDMIVRVNTFTVSVVVLICAAIMFILNNSATVRIVKNILGAVAFVFGRLLGLLFSGEANEPAETIITAPVENGSGYGGLPQVETTWVTDLLNWIGIVIGVAVAIGLIIMILIVVVKKVKGIKTGTGTYVDIREFIAPSNVLFSRVKRAKEEEEENLPHNLKARKLYKTTVLKSFKKNSTSRLRTMSPSEISKQYVGEDAEATRIYEKARYSCNDVSDKEIEYLTKIKKNKR